jgi:tripartite-type tricarboxylate transporter receptor subunit TctC
MYRPASWCTLAAGEIHQGIRRVRQGAAARSTTRVRPERSAISGELLSSLTKIKIVHIPYKGIAPATIDLVAGHVQLSFASIPVIIGHVRSGRLRLLAQGGETRATSLPQIPTMQEAGVPGFVVSSPFSLIGPAGIPRPIAERLNDALVKALQDPANRKALIDQGAEPIGNAIAEHAAFIAREIAKWRKVIQDAGIQPQ